MSTSRAYPYWDEPTKTTVYGHYGDWMVSVAPMMFNDRILLTHKDLYPDLVNAGFCYDKGPAAVLAALAWDPTVDHLPAGFKKVAFDDRPLPEGYRECRHCQHFVVREDEEGEARMDGHLDATHSYLRPEDR